MNFFWPLKEIHITQSFGNRSRSYALGYHMGIDLRAPRRTPVYAAQAGKVAVSKVLAPFDGYGCHVVIDHLNGLFTMYGHLDESIVKIDQNVSIGQLIGYSGGNSKDYPKPKPGTYSKAGFSSAYHLHYEIDKDAIGARHCINPTPITKFFHETPMIQIPEFAKPVAEKAKLKGLIVDWSDPLQMVGTEKQEWIFEKLGLLDPEKHEGGLSLSRFAIVIDKLGLIDKLPDKK